MDIEESLYRFLLLDKEKNYVSIPIIGYRIIFGYRKTILEKLKESDRVEHRFPTLDITSSLDTRDARHGLQQREKNMVSRS